MYRDQVMAEWCVKSMAWPMRFISTDTNGGLISSNERLAFHRIPAGMMEVISRRWYDTPASTETGCLRRAAEASATR